MCIEEWSWLDRRLPCKKLVCQRRPSFFHHQVKRKLHGGVLRQSAVPIAAAIIILGTVFATLEITDLLCVVTQELLL